MAWLGFNLIKCSGSYLGTYGAFHGFGQAKFAYGGSILGSSLYKLLPQLPLKTMLNLKLVKIDSKIINLIQ